MFQHDLRGNFAMEVPVSAGNRATSIYVISSRSWYRGGNLPIIDGHRRRMFWNMATFLPKNQGQGKRPRGLESTRALALCED